MPRSQKQRTDGVYDSYPDTWPEIARKIKAANNWRCERCGHPHETPTARAACDDRCTHVPDGKQRVLTVHHLDMDKSNVALWNLAALCQACHLSVQARVDFAQQYMLEHSPWMRRHVEAFLAEKKGPLDIRGRWPGDETDEEINRALEDLS